MIDFLSSTRLVDMILGIVIIEMGAITIWWRAAGRGIPPALLLPNLSAGLLLLLALRFALSGYSWPFYVACLALSGLANAADLWQRWR